MARVLKRAGTPPEPPDPVVDSPLGQGVSPKRAVPGAAHGTGPWGVSNAPAGRVVLNPDGGGSFTAPMGGTPEDEAARFRQYAYLHLRQQFPDETGWYFLECAKQHIEEDIAEAVFMAAVNGFAQQRGLDLKALQVDAQEGHGVEWLAKAYVSNVGGGPPINVIGQWLNKAANLVWNAVNGVAAKSWGVGQIAASGAMQAQELVKQAGALQAAFGRKRLYDAAKELPKTGAPSDLSPKEREKLNKEREKLNNKVASLMSKMKGWSSDERARFMRSLWGDTDATSLIDQIQELQGRIDRGDDGKRWGQMAKRLLRMGKRAVRHSFRHRPTFVGAFRYPHRALIPAMDGRAWHAKLVGLGGTILLDHSGSMGINEEQLQQLLHRSPVATIAAYSGGDYIGTDGWSAGHLTILAKEGRYAAQSVWPAFPGGNVVDGPALRWLAKQARPRVWISDGKVTAALENSPGEHAADDAMELECALLARMAGISQYYNIAMYLESHHYLSQFR